MRIVQKYSQSSRFGMDLISVLPLSTLYNIVAALTGIVFIDLHRYVPGTVAKEISWFILMTMFFFNSVCMYSYVCTVYY